MEDPKDSPLGKKYGMLSTFFPRAAFDSLKTLEPCERLFAYYMSQAVICGYPIALSQLCSHENVVHQMYNLLETLEKMDPSDSRSKWLDQIKVYWVYLFSNYGVHFIRESQNNKKVPKDMGLELDRKILESLGLELRDIEWKYLLDSEFFPTGKVEGSIEESGNNFYGPGLTTKEYDSLPPQKKRKLNAYHTKHGTESYSVSGKCGGYLSNCSYWIHLALEIARSYPERFDIHCVASLESLLEYFFSGDEAYFKDHSLSWTQMKNRVEYNLGFIEYYDDPMGQIGTFQGDVTVKGDNLVSLLQKLPGFEAKFPFPREWKREDMSKIPNAANAQMVMGIGMLGPLYRVSAYCLPNYDDLRSRHGSKQVIYSKPPPSDLEKYKKIYLSDLEVKFYQEASPDLSLQDRIDSLMTTLHETIGHASGSLFYHDDEENSIYSQTNQMVQIIDDKMYTEFIKSSKPTGSILTRKRVAELVGPWANALEEMRAEILALYTGITFLSDIINTGFLGKWNVATRDFEILMILEIAGAGWKRWGNSTPDGETKVTGAHALADTAILYYLIDNSDGGLQLEVQMVGNLPVMRLLWDANKLPVLRKAIRNMAITVQRFTSTAPIEEIDAFMKKYASSTRNPEYSKIVRGMAQAYKGDIKASVRVFPEWIPVYDEYEVIVDVVPYIPSDPVEHFKGIYKTAYGLI